MCNWPCNQLTPEKKFASFEGNFLEEALNSNNLCIGIQAVLNGLQYLQKLRIHTDFYENTDVYDYKL